MRKLLRYLWNLVSNLIWKEIKHTSKGKFIYYQSEQIFKSFTIQTDDAKIFNSLMDYNKREYNEYIYEYNGDIVIEPNYGWGLLPNNELLYWSLPYHYYTNPPDLRDWIRLKIQSKLIKKIDTIISFRDIGEGNYFHFYDEIITKFSLLQNYKIPINDIPVLISKSIYDQNIFKDFIKYFHFDKFSYLVQDNEYFEAKRVIFCKTYPLQKKYYKYLDRINLAENKENKSDKIFLVRNKTAQRTIKNFDEIIDISIRYGFSILDTDNMKLMEQIEAFRDIKCLIGIHGAGLTNMIFCKQKLKVLEIFPPNNIPPHYYWLATNWGFEYNAIMGESNGKIENLPMTIKADFYLEPQNFENAIASIV